MSVNASEAPAVAGDVARSATQAVMAWLALSIRDFPDEASVMIDPRITIEVGLVRRAIREQEAAR